LRQPPEETLVFDWSEAGPHRFARPEWPVALDDETLRDGLQSPSATDPPVEIKLRILHLMDRLGIETADVGLPGAGPRQREAVERLCREIASQRLRIRANCAGRTVLADVQPMADLAQKTGVPIEACLFIGSSPIRQYAEEWDVDHILARTQEAVRFAVRENLEVMYVTEDTVRSAPDHLRILLSAAIDAGAARVCLCDTVGAAIPAGARNLVTWVKALLDEMGVGERVGIDWHGHRDRGLGLANTLAAIEAGATRVHGTALGVGERVGNTPMEEILVNLKLLGVRNDDLTCLPDYVQAVSAAFDVPIPVNTPIVGRDAFRTATGVHAAAVIKAQRKGDAWLADRIYSGVPASWLGREQEIVIGHMSGGSNVLHYLKAHGLPDGPDVVQAVLAAAKRSERLLSHDEIVAAARASPPAE
jgi:2-isopropylmalate synthase